LREVVVVFDGLKCGFLAVEAEVVDRDGVREEGLDCVDHAEAGAENGDQG